MRLLVNKVYEFWLTNEVDSVNSALGILRIIQDGKNC